MVDSKLLTHNSNLSPQVVGCIRLRARGARRSGESGVVEGNLLLARVMDGPVPLAPSALYSSPFPPYQPFLPSQQRAWRETARASATSRA